MKNGGEVFAYIPDWLRDLLVARAKRYRSLAGELYGSSVGQDGV